MFHIGASHQLSSLLMVMYLCQTYPPLPPVSTHLFSMSVSLFLPCKYAAAGRRSAGCAACACGCARRLGRRRRARGGLLEPAATRVQPAALSARRPACAAEPAGGCIQGRRSPARARRHGSAAASAARLYRSSIYAASFFPHSLIWMGSWGKWTGS